VAGTQDFGLGIKSWKTTALVWAGAVLSVAAHLSR